MPGATTSTASPPIPSHVRQRAHELVQAFDVDSGSAGGGSTVQKWSIGSEVRPIDRHRRRASTLTIERAGSPIVGLGLVRSARCTTRPLCTGRSAPTATPQGSQTVGGPLDVIRGRVEGCEREQRALATRSYRCSYCHEQGHNVHACPIAARDLDELLELRADNERLQAKNVWLRTQVQGLLIDIDCLTHRLSRLRIANRY
jgi:hypothetical protein